MRLVLLAGLLIGSALAAAPAAAASFDCGKASSPDEKAVCADPLLSELDSRMGKAYKAARAGSFADEAKTASRNFLADRAGCGSERACLIASYVGLLQFFQNVGVSSAAADEVTAETIAKGNAPRSQELPKTIGACVTTAIDSIHPRLGDGGPPKDSDYDFGTGVEYADGGRGVSYEREAALLRSQPGDPVIMCLVSIPRGCPPGDDRGRFYIVTNERTGESWTLPDSQHMCGGA